MRRLLQPKQSLFVGDNMKSINIYSRPVFQVSEGQRTRFNELASMAKVLHVSCVEGEQLCPGFTNIIGDVWVAFCAIHPRLLPNAKQIDDMQFEFIQNLMNAEEYTRWHHLTQGDELLSVLSAVAIAERLKEMLKDDKVSKQAVAQKKLAQRSQEYASKQLQELRKKMNDPNVSKAEKERAAMQKNLVHRILTAAQQDQAQANEAVRKQISTMSNATIAEMLKSTAQKVKHSKNTIVAVGTMDGKKIQQVPLSDQFELANHLKEHKTLQKIADLAGRFKKIAQKKQKTKQRMTMERKNVTLGQEVARLLPTEIANFILPHSKLDFLRRYAEQQTFIFDTKGKDRRGKGPIIICMDESSSMTSIKEESKAFCMALLMIARKQKRDFAIVPFASDIGEVQIFLKGRASVQDLIHYSNSFLGGGTNYEKPLRASLNILKESKFNEADLIFVTDGSSFLSSSFIEEFNLVKKNKQFECTSIVLKNAFNTVDLNVVNKFSDKVLEVNELFEAEEAFVLS